MFKYLKKNILRVTVPLITAMLVVLWSDVALAWGPMAHLEFARQVLISISSNSTHPLSFLLNYPASFLYGCVAADIVVAKNLAQYINHCHNWQAAKRIMEAAGNDEPDQAFAYGYYSHLASDVIAHNYYIPFKIVESYPTRSLGHAYWEIRFDELAGKNTASLIKQFNLPKLKIHNHLLEDEIKATMFSIKTNQKIFNSLLAIQRLKKWRKVTSVISDRSKWQLPLKEYYANVRMSVDSILDFLQNGDEAKCLNADPTGIRNLNIAKRLRKSLRDKKKSKVYSDIEFDLYIQQTNQSFLNGIENKLQLPNLEFIQK